METAVIAAIITSSAAVIGPIVTYYVTKGRTNASAVVITKLNSRIEVYETAAVLIKNGRHVVDTSWGSATENLTNTEKGALDRYIEARRLAIARDNTDYRELFTLTSEAERIERYQKAIEASERQPAYLAMLLGGIDPGFPLIDFLVADRKHVIFSLLSAGSARSGHQYLYLQSPEVAELLIEYFDACWQYGQIQQKQMT